MRGVLVPHPSRHMIRSRRVDLILKSCHNELNSTCSKVDMLHHLPPVCNLSNVLCRNTIILDLLIHKTILRLRRVIRHLNLIVDDIIHVSVLAQPLRQLADGDATQIRR